MAQRHPKGLLVLALANMGERFGYYTMLAILTLYLQAKFGLSSATTSWIYSIFLALIYFLPVFGGVVADKWLGYGRTILIGVVIMFGGYLLLGMPFGASQAGLAIMLGALLLISIGTGLFKGNLQALVGKIYDDPKYAKGRDIAFSIFYLFINIGSLFAPSMGQAITNGVLKDHHFAYYNADIPANYNRFNDRLLSADEETAFIQAVQAKHSDWATMAAEEQDKAITKAKSDEGVLFQADADAAEFNLKLAGLNQYTVTGKITDPALMVTDDDYRLAKSRVPEQQAARQELLDRVAAAEVPAGLVPLEEGVESKGFARDFGYEYVQTALSTSYSYAFFVACISLIISILIFVLGRKTWKFADVTAKQAMSNAAEQGKKVKPMPKEEVRERMFALILVFIVVIFFWMAFHQNGLTLTFFARDYTVSQVDPTTYGLFNIGMLVAFIVFMYGIYSMTMGLLGSEKNKKLGLGLIVAGLVALVVVYMTQIKPLEGMQNITPQIFQQFNPFFIVLLTPITVGIFAALAAKGKEPSAPRKIGIGMIMAGVGFLVMLICALTNQLPAPGSLNGGTSPILVQPEWLIGTYLTLTVAELFLSPMGLSFVSKVAPPQYSGLMQGGWLAATAVGNMLVGVMGNLWDKISMPTFFIILIACCGIAAVFIFSIMGRLERVTEDKPEEVTE